MLDRPKLHRELAQDIVNETLPAKHEALRRSEAALAEGAPIGFVLSTPEPDIWFLERSRFSAHEFSLSPNVGGLEGALLYVHRDRAEAARERYHDSLDPLNREACAVEVVTAEEGLNRHIAFLRRRIAEDTAFARRHGAL